MFYNWVSVRIQPLRLALSPMCNSKEEQKSGLGVYNPNWQLYHIIRSSQQVIKEGNMVTLSN